MINNVFLNQVKKYKPNTITDIKNAMKEVLQDIILSGLGKSDFFKYAVFYGGTSLRIFRNLPRFSEDLDFTLINNDMSFSLDGFLEFVKKELNSLDIEFELYRKEKNVCTTVDSVYFKFNLKYLFGISYKEMENSITSNELLSIKVEVEKNSFEGGIIETKILTYPSFIQIKTFSMETLFASKLIAVLNRNWQSRIKGRDFYDYLFYISNEVKVNLTFLENGLKKFGYLKDDETMTLDRLKNDLKNRFECVDFENAKDDVLPFVGEDDRFISAFNRDIFIGTIELIKINN